MRIGIYQNYPRFGEVERNIAEAVQALKGVEADLMVLPELFNTGYQFLSRKEVETLAEEIPSGKTTQAFQGVSHSLGAYLVFGLAEREGAKCYNSAVITGPQGYIGTYRKAHLFGEEKGLFDPGNTGFRVFDLGEARVGIMICFDWLFPECARALALLGADIICHPANLVLPHGQRAMVTRSLENGVYSATANRIGTEARGGKKPLVFTGGSQILDYRGQILERMGEEETGVGVADVEIERARDKRITPQNDRLADRR
ncbi:MAG: nitrilase-related carbon-nitrogen hydrolase, partial [Pseudomonadota bacterium]